jgi:hypothetical protein
MLTLPLLSLLLLLLLLLHWRCCSICCASGTDKAHLLTDRAQPATPRNGSVSWLQTVIASTAIADVQQQHLLSLLGRGAQLTANRIIDTWQRCIVASGPRLLPDQLLLLHTQRLPEPAFAGASDASAAVAAALACCTCCAFDSRLTNCAIKKGVLGMAQRWSTNQLCPCTAYKLEVKDVLPIGCGSCVTSVEYVSRAVFQPGSHPIIT